MLIHYQPVVDIRTRKVLRAEAFCRFPDGPPGLGNPGGFIPFAEENGLIHGLTMWLISNATKYWKDLGPAAPELMVNLSTQNLQERDLPERVIDALGANGFDPRRLWVELGEEMLEIHDGTSHDTLRRLAKAGVKLCLDGLGPTLTVVTHLQLGELPIGELKLDPSVTDALDVDPVQRAKVASVMEIARHLKIEVAAKGVERRELLGWLAHCGVGRVQGYAIAPPMDGETFKSWLEARDASALSA